MDFLAPLMLVGAAGLAIPVVIHLIGRRRARVVRFAALDFLLASNRKTARRLQLRELILLVVRALVCLAIPLALAKPFTTCATSGPVVERGPQAAVIVIDNSMASRYQRDGVRLLDLARQKAADILQELGPEADIAIVPAAQNADSPSELSRDHLRLRDTLSDIRPSTRPADLTVALKRAAQLLASSNHARNTIYLLSPLQATGFSGEAPWPEDSGPRLAVIDLAEGAELPNLAVTDVEVGPDPASGSRGIEVVAEVANFSAGPAERGIALRLGDRVVARGTLSVGAGERAKKRFLAALPAGNRQADVVVELDGDALAIDDRRHVRAELREEIRVLLVNGDPHTVKHDDELFYLEAALRPGDRDDSGTSLRKTTLDDLDAIDLAEHDVVVLANVRALPDPQVTALARWVQGGGGLLIAPGDNVDADAYNETMQPLMPQRLNTTLDITYGSRGAEREERALRLTRWEADHPVFRIFSKDAPGLREARFTRVMLLGPTTRVDERRVLARYTNGAAALVEARSGRGRLMFFTSSVDRGWNDLPIHPGFLPLMQQSVRYLARKQASRSDAAALVGEGVVLQIQADDVRLEIRGPDGSRSVLEGDAIADRNVVRFSDTRVPGFYRVSITDRSDRELPRPEADFAVNVDVRGSDLRPVDAARLPASGTGAGGPAESSHRRRVELWHAIALGLLLLMLVEGVLVQRA